jgi:hypothetical protein
MSALTSPGTENTNNDCTINLAQQKINVIIGLSINSIDIKSAWYPTIK